jgi:putative endonuclease
MKTYYVYILSNKTRTIYVGVTKDLEGRVSQHKSDIQEGFTKAYRVKQLVCYEEFDNVFSAIEREKQIKGWRRSKKVALIKASNPKWQDLSKDWK